MTKSQRRIIEATERGYYIKDGCLYGPKGLIKARCYGKQRYPTFSTNWDGCVYGLPIHQFAAYQYYGLAAFDPKTQVRHLDGNVLNFNKENIVLGTSSENQMDKCKERRINAAKVARASQGKTPLNAKLTPKEVLEIRNLYAGLEGKKAPNGFLRELTKRYGVSTTVINLTKRGIYHAG